MNRIPVSSPASVAVFRRILTHGPIGRVEVSRATGLSQAAVTKAVTPLIAAGFVVESEADRRGTAIGRPVSPLAVVHGRAHIVGVKVTAERSYGVLVDLGANIVSRIEAVNRSSEVEDIVDVVRGIVEALGADTTIDGIGVAVSGDVDRARGVVRDSPLLGWRGVALAELLEAAIGAPVVVENDVRALTVTEQFFGAGRDADSFAVITIGTGIGCGLFLNERIVNGSHGVAGEIGHLPLAPGDRVCSCGRRGCVEAVASTGAIVDQLRERLDDPSLDIGDVFRLAHEGEPAAVAAFATAGEVIGAALAALVNLTGPELVVIAGENVTEYALYENRIRAAFAEHAFGAAADCRIVLRPHTFDDWARGAAVCVIEAIASGVV
ncbi:MAG: ROK family transcriptional regulator [Protaetiibacter sp.]